MSSSASQLFHSLIRSHTGRGIVFGVALMVWRHVHTWFSLGFPALLIATALGVASIAFLVAGRCKVPDAWGIGRLGTAVCIVLLLFNSVVLIGSWTCWVFLRTILQEMTR